MSSLTASIQCSCGSNSHSNQIRKRNKIIQVGREEVKLSLYANDMIFYIRMHVQSLSQVSLQPHGLSPTRLLCPWEFPGKNTRVGCHFLLQGIFPTQGLNPCLLHWQAGSLPLSHQGSPGFCIEYPKIATQILLELINELSKTAGYKIHIPKSVAFLYTNNEICESKKKKKII